MQLWRKERTHHLTAGQLWRLLERHLAGWEPGATIENALPLYDFENGRITTVHASVVTASQRVEPRRYLYRCHDGAWLRLV
ncbi:MAG: hypothetical protein IT307_03375 [Chloroflexi bacterium]|nr:hypothetical protein [Chloroflexota bacterium]